jgi:putative aldouronate transport system substrate-binding protein
MKSILKKVAVIVLSVTLLAGCSPKTKVTAPAATETLKFWTWKGTEDLMKMDTKDIQAVKELSTRTGVPIEWANPSDPTTEFQMFMTSGENLPDAMYYKYTPQDVLGYAANGNIIDLSSYIEKYMPNLKKLMDSNAVLKAQMTSEDGKVYYLPWITEEKEYYEGLMLRQDWLDATGLTVPKNNEELYQVLKAEKALFTKGKLPNAGAKFYGLSGYPTQLMKLAYGFDATDDWMIQDGKVVYGPTTDGFRKAMAWFSKLSKEGLLDPDTLSMDGDIYTQHHTNNLTAGFVDNYGSFQQTELANSKIHYVPVGYMQDSKGVSMEYNSTAKRVAQPYGWAISKSGEKKIQEICKVFDYSYSPEGQTLMSWGIKGDTFEVKDGVNVYTDKIMKDAQYAPSIAQAKYVKPDFGITDTKTNNALIDARGQETFKLWANTDFSQAMEPTVWTTKEETDLISQVKTDLKTGMAEYRDKFMMGKLDPSNDKVWSQFTTQLTKLREKDITAAYDTAYQRFAKRAGR